MNNNTFFSKVYTVTRKIPAGRITTYGAIARHIGSPQAARMVGFALNSSIGISPFVPAHRVVNRNGLLTGKKFFGGQNTMKELLENEGVKIKDDKIIDFGLVFWDPNKHL